MTWAPRNAHYQQLRTTHHKLLLRVIGYRHVHGTYRNMSYAKALKKTGSQSVEATIRQRRLLFAGALAKQGDKRLPKQLLFAERLEGGKTRDPASRHSTGRKARGTTSRHSGPYTAPRQLIGGLRSRQARLDRGGAQGGGSAVVHRGSCWRRRDLWRRGTRAKKRVASYARYIERLKSAGEP